MNDKAQDTLGESVKAEGRIRGQIVRGLLAQIMRPDIPLPVRLFILLILFAALSFSVLITLFILNVIASSLESSIEIPVRWFLTAFIILILIVVVPLVPLMKSVVEFERLNRLAGGFRDASSVGAMQETT